MTESMKLIFESDPPEKKIEWADRRIHALENEIEQRCREISSLKKKREKWQLEKDTKNGK